MLFLAAFFYNVPATIIAGVLFIALFLFHLLGIRLGRLQKKLNPEAKGEGLGPLEGALLGLLALMLSFTFNMSASRYDGRRNTVVKEANHIAAAIARADMYPDSIRMAFRNDFKQYLEARIAYHDARSSIEKADQAIKDATVVSDRLWKTATDYARRVNSPIPSGLMIPELNEMIDIVTTRDAANKSRVPASVIWLLVMLSLLASCVIGYSKKEKRNDWIILTLYSLMTVLTIHTIIDLDRPTRGFITTEIENHKIIELRELFKHDDHMNK